MGFLKKKSVNTDGAINGTVVVLLTQISNIAALTAVCAMHKLKVDTVASPVGAYAVAHDVSEAGRIRLATLVSQTARDSKMILFVGHRNEIQATQWQAGHPGDTVPPPLALDGAPHELTDILLGNQRASDQEEWMSSAGMSKFKALRILVAINRQKRSA